MLRRILIVALLGWIVQSAHIPNNNRIITFSERLEGLIRKKCFTNANISVAAKAVGALHEFKMLWQILLPSRSIIGDELYKYCMYQTINNTKHLALFMEELAPCMAPQEKYLKKLIVNSYGDHNNYFCNSLRAASTKKLSVWNCYRTFNNTPELNPVNACYKNSKVFGDHSTIDVITEQEFCSDLATIRNCYEKLLDEHCPDAEETKDLKMIVLRQALENCDRDFRNLERLNH